MCKHEKFRPAKRLVTVPNAAHSLACSERQVWRFLKRGDLERISLGGMTRTTEDSIEALINRGKT